MKMFETTNQINNGEIPMIFPEIPHEQPTWRFPNLPATTAPSYGVQPSACNAVSRSRGTARRVVEAKRRPLKAVLCWM
jgi:hypothetical protein